MLTRITFANGKTLDVAAEPLEVHEQVLAGHGTAVPLRNTQGEPVYVNPAAIAYFEAEVVYDGPIVDVIG